MPSTAAGQKIVTLVPQKGVKLPVSECVLSKETPDEYLVQATTKTGRGRGTKHVLRTFRIPKKEVLYLYKDEEISAEDAANFPTNGVSAVAAAPAAAAPPKKKGGRPKKEKVATTEAPKRRGRPKKDATVDATPVAPKKRGRPKKVVTTEEGATPEATSEKAPPKKKGGRPKKEKAATTAAPKKKGGRPKKVAVPEEVASTDEDPAKAAAKEATPKKQAPSKASSIFDEDF